jgi:hypothetical protein
MRPPRSATTTAVRLPAVLLVVLAAAATYAFLRYPTYPNYDSLTALLWARDLLDGNAPAFDSYRAPTQHPLLLPVGLLLAPLGDLGARLFVALTIAGLLALVVAAYRLGLAAAGVLCGLLAAAIIASRLNLALLASIGFLDLPYCALVAWAAVLETRRPRCGRPVWILLTLAGLLRPEAWLLAGLYGLWLALPALGRRDVGAVVRSVAPAAIAPVVWAIVDLAVTGDPLFSFHHTDALAAELRRDRGTLELPWLMVRLLSEVLKPPLMVAAVGGIAAAVALRNRALLLPAVLVVVTCATYLLIAGGGLATVYRYLLNAAVGLAVFAAFALAGWATVDRSRALRLRWMVPALALLVLGAGYTAVRTSPAKATAELRERVRIREDLVAVLRDPAVTRARACGPLTVPTHKLLAEVRWILELPQGGVTARSDPAQPPQRSGVAIIIDRRIARRPALDVLEVGRDGTQTQVPPRGFVPVAGNRRFAAYASCDPQAPARRSGPGPGRT